MSKGKGRACRHAILRLGAEGGLALSEEQAERCCRHLELVEMWNRRVNLTRITGFDALVRHVLDSLVPSIWLPDVGRALDVGSGAGFPGVPLAIVFPRLQVTLLESDRKKSSFLKFCAADLGLTNVVVVHGRVEEISRGLMDRRRVETSGSERELESFCFDLTTVRAVRVDSILLEHLGFLLRSNGIVAYWAGPTSQAHIPGDIPLRTCFETFIPIRLKTSRTTRDTKKPEVAPDHAGLSEASAVLVRLEDREYVLPADFGTRRLLRWVRRDL